MKHLFYILILGFIIFLDLGPSISTFLLVSEQDIGKNITHLKKHQWFQDILSNEAYKQLIIHDNDVRNTIGKFNSKRLDYTFFRKKYRKKLQSILDRKLNCLT